jgi:hypothetical protein
MPYSVHCAHDCLVFAFRAHIARYPEMSGGTPVRISCGLIKLASVSKLRFAALRLAGAALVGCRGAQGT